MEHLDARLGTIAAMVPRCRAVADIGCDHGLLVAALLEGGRCDYGIAADINPMPLEKARQELTRRGLLAQSECRLTNGLCGIAPVGVDAVVIAGMGGELIADILSRWDYTENPAITYLLQPMTRPVHLRRWLYTHRFTLQEERCCRANGKLYTVLRAQYTGCATEETPAALYFGALDLENDPLAGEYREQVLGRLRRRITGLVEAKRCDKTEFLRGAGRGAAPPAAGGRHELRSCVSALPKRAAPREPAVSAPTHIFAGGRGERAAGPAARSAAVSGRSPLKPSVGRFGLRPELAPCTIHTQTKRK